MCICALITIRVSVRRMATQSLSLENSDQLESSLSIGERTKALILDVQEFRQAFDLAEKGAHEVAGKLFRDLAELIKYCAMVRSYLSERGHNAHLRKEAGIPAGFERWYIAFRNQHDIAWAYKTMLHKIAEYYETETGEEYWISGPRRDGLDRLYGKSALVVEIDADVREEYWAEIRKQPEQRSKSHTQRAVRPGFV